MARGHDGDETAPTTATTTETAAPPTGEAAREDAAAVEENEEPRGGAAVFCSPSAMIDALGGEIDGIAVRSATSRAPATAATAGR